MTAPLSTLRPDPDAALLALAVEIEHAQADYDAALTTACNAVRDRERRWREVEQLQGLIFSLEAKRRALQKGQR